MAELMISKLFPNKVLTEEEEEWVRKYHSFFEFNPRGTEQVTDEASFLKMAKDNAVWLELFVQDGISAIEEAARELPYYEELTYSSNNNEQ